LLDIGARVFVGSDLPAAFDKDDLRHRAWVLDIGEVAADVVDVALQRGPVRKAREIDRAVLVVVTPGDVVLRQEAEDRRLRPATGRWHIGWPNVPKRSCSEEVHAVRFGIRK